MEAYRTRHLSDHTRGTSGTTHGHVSIDWRRAVMTRPVRPRRVHWRAWLTWVLWHLMLRRVWGILLVGRVGRARGRNGGVCKEACVSIPLGAKKAKVDKLA